MFFFFFFFFFAALSTNGGGRRLSFAHRPVRASHAPKAIIKSRIALASRFHVQALAVGFASDRESYGRRRKRARFGRFSLPSLALSFSFPSFSSSPDVVESKEQGRKRESSKSKEEKQARNSPSPALFRPLSQPQEPCVHNLGSKSTVTTRISSANREERDYIKSHEMWPFSFFSSP